MPNVVIKHGHYYGVINAQTGRVHSYSTSLKNAKAQVRLLNAVEHGYKPTKK